MEFAAVVIKLQVLWCSDGVYCIWLQLICVLGKSKGFYILLAG